MRHGWLASWLSLLTLVPACGDGAAEGPPGSPSRNVTQGGPQDIGEFRRVVEARNVPSSDLLDPVGFFNEHAVDLPPASCGDAVCFHPMLAVAPRFDDGNWTMAYVAMNTAVDPRTIAVGPRHIIVVVERSRAIAEVEASLGNMLAPLVNALRADDVVSVVVATQYPSALVVADTPARLGTTLASIEASMPPTAYYDKVDAHGALVLAYQLSQTAPLAGHQQQVLFFTSGRADVGIQDRSAFESLASQFAARQMPITVFGLGRDYQREMPRTVSELSAGNYHFANGPADLAQALAAAGKTGFVPLARNLRLQLRAHPGYRIGRIYGASRVATTEQEATLMTPVLYIGARTDATDVMTGRRGGGGGFFVELLADAPDRGSPPAPADAFTLTASYEDGRTGASLSRDFTLQAPLGVGHNPPPDAPFFSDKERAKPFMMLNMYLALSSSLALLNQGRCGASLGIVDMMERSYIYWQRLYDDPDIDADFELLRDLTEAIRIDCTAPAAQEVTIPTSCFFL